MICYKDKTFCPYYDFCTLGRTCDRALTKEVKEDAYAWWGAAVGEAKRMEAPLSIYVRPPECFEFVESKE